MTSGFPRMIQDSTRNDFLPGRDLIGLRSHRVFESRDIDHTRDEISRILQPHVLNPHGRWVEQHCYAEHLPIGNLGIGTIRFGNMHVHVPSIADYHLAIICLDGHAQMAINQTDYRIGGKSGLLIAPGEEMKGTFSADCEQLFIRISSAAVRSHTGIRDLVFKKEIDLSNTGLRPWLNQLSLIASDVVTAELVRGHQIIAKEYERLLISLLLDGQPYLEQRSGASAIAPASVRRAETFIHDNASESITLEDIAMAAQVPVRTLLDSFKRFRNVSPIRYLKDVRLDIAREKLRSGEGVTASSVAFEAGFNHLGRFAGDYLRRFGEKPSDTLRGNGSAQ
ncbi:MULTISPECIES: AraC family transcriptional regulator [Sphingobium]|nr:AraC family transcriptional regulator [Sphingobium indicum]